MTRLGTAKRLFFGMALAAVGAWAIVLPLPGCNTPFIPIRRLEIRRSRR